MSLKDFLKETNKELSNYPGVEYQVVYGKRHPQLVLSYNNNQRKKVFPKSASDRRAIKNHVSDIRKVLRELGAVKAVC